MEEKKSNGGWMIMFNKFKLAKWKHVEHGCETFKKTFLIKRFRSYGMYKCCYMYLRNKYFHKCTQCLINVMGYVGNKLLKIS